MSGLYIHIPFCERKCIYCDFYSVEQISSIDAFLDALSAEFALVAPHVKGDNYSTVYFGGGTPSLLTPSQLEKIFIALSESFSIHPDSEITLEANPGTVTIEKLQGYKALGVNRISFGIQSFHEDELRFLSRIHTVDQAVESVRRARGAGFENISIDLMMSLPGQTVQKLEYSLQRAVELEPEHISAYSLTIEEPTPLYRMVKAGEVTPVQPDRDADLYEFSMEFLQKHGFEHYEVSNYAKPGLRSRHNSNYWKHKPYSGFGPSAHSFRDNRRWRNIADVNLYCDRLFKGETVVSEEEGLTTEQLLEEAIFLGLRSDGVNLRYLKEHYGFRVTEPVRNLLNEWVDDGLAVTNGASLRLTSRGYLQCDELCARLLSITTGSGAEKKA